MIRIHLILKSLTISALLLQSVSLSLAATLETDINLSSSRYLEGINLTDDQPTIGLNADISFDNGLFTRLGCYAADSNSNNSLRVGCDTTLGYFTTLNKQQALSVEVTQHSYSRARSSGWNFVELTANWHLNQQSTVSVGYSRDWLQRGFDTFSIKGDFNKQISNRFNANLILSASSLDGGQFGTNELFYAKASLQYTLERWSAQMSFIISDDGHERVVPFDVDQPALNFSISYKLY